MSSECQPSPQSFDLSTIIAPLSFNIFIQEYWNVKPYWIVESAQNVDRLSRLMDNFQETMGLPSLMAGYSGAVSLLKPDGTVSEAQGFEQAQIAYEDGFTCYFRSVEADIPNIKQACDDLGATLGIPSRYISSELFCAKAGSGVAMHSDYDVNFAFLLRGQKSWKLAKNELIENQPGVCIGGVAEQPHPKVNKLTQGKDFPKTMPENSIAITVKEGSMIYMPRGWWHETQAEGECMQLNFVIKGPQLSALFLEAIEAVIERDSDWREFADNTMHNPDMTAAKLASLIGNFRKSILDTTDAQLAEQVIRLTHMNTDV